jgi:hypothetical protein
MRKRNKTRIIRIILISGAFIVLTVSLLAYLFKPKSVEAVWFSDSWLYRSPINISNSSGSNLTDFQVSVTVDSDTLTAAGKLQNDCDDLRFTDNTGNLLPYWIEDSASASEAVTCNSADVTVWIRIPSVPTTGAILYMYYGNNNAGAASNGKLTFPFFEDFGDSTLNTRTWTATGTASITSGEIAISTGAIYLNSSLTFIPANYHFEQRVKWTDTTGNNSGLTVAEAQSVAVNNSTSLMVSSLAISNTTSSFIVGAFAGDGGAASYNVVNGSTQYTATSGVYHISGVGFDSSTMKYYNNRTLTNSYTGSISAYPYLYLGYLIGSAASTIDGRNMTTDWLIARKYASTAPSTSFGTEEQGTVPVVYFKLDEGKGTTTYDSISNLGATFVGNPVWKDENECISGRCLYFDGVDDYAIVSPAPALIKNATRTISFWFKPISFASTQGILSLASTNYYVGITTSGRLIESHQNSSNAQISNTTANNSIKGNAWQHVNVVVSSGTINYYLNGKLLESDTFADGHGSTYGSSLRIGNVTAAYFNGFVDELRVYNYARSSSQVLGEYNSRGSDIGDTSAQIGSGGPAKGESLSDGLNVWWKMDESSWNGTSSEVLDASQSSINGTSQCDVTYNTCASGVPSTTVSGLYGRAGNFNQDGQRVYVDNTDLSTNERFESEAIWINPDTLPTSTNKMHFLVQFGTYDATSTNSTTVTNIRNNLYINSSGTISLQALSYTGSSLCSNFGLGQYLNQTLTTSTAITAGTWNHVAYTINWGSGSEININLYLNGRLESSFNEVGRSCYSENNHTWIGKAKGTGSSYIDFDGKIDEYRRYKKILMPEEVNALYSVWTPGPVGYWNLDENTGTTAGNAANSSNNGTLTNGPTWVQGRYGNAVNFDGSNDYITATTTGLVTGSGARTLAGWVYLTVDNSSVKVPFAYGTCGINNQAFGVSLNAGESLTFYGCLGGDYGVSSTLNINTWYHIAITYDTSKVRIYLNGIQVGEVARSLDTGTTAMSIGSDGTIDGGDYPFPGYVDDVRAYNFALSSKQIVNIMNGSVAGDYAIGSPIGHPVLYYKFDEGYDSFTYNSNNSSLLGTLNNISSPATASSGWTSNGKVNNAIVFDNINDYVSVGDAADISPTTGLTISAWVNRSTNNSADGIVGKYNSAANRRSYILGFNTSTAQLILSPNGTSITTVSGTTTIGTGQWYHIVGTYDGSYMRIYVNGNLEGSATYSSGIYDSTDDLRIGDGDIGLWPFNGIIDEVKLYNFALNSDEIKLDYNQSKSVVLGSLSTTSTGVGDNSASRKYCVPGDSSTCNPPIVEWNFDENTGSIINDSLGNANTGTLTNGPVWSNGKYGSSVRLDGTDDHITIASSTSLNSGTSAITFSTWAKAYSTSDSYVALKFATASPNGSGDYWLSVSSNKWSAKTSGGTGSVSSIDNVQTNQWYHLALVWTSGSTMSFYVNGVLQGTDATSGTISNASQPLWFGRWDTVYFNGEVDTARFYTNARSAAQIAWEYNQGQPQYYYKLDECQGSVAYNTAKNGNGDSNSLDGTITIGGTGTNTTLGTCTGSAGTSWKDGAIGMYGASLEFDGTDDKVDTSTSASLNMTGQSFTISAWFKTSQVATATFMMIRDGGGTAANVLGGFPINITAGKVSFDTWDSATNRITSTKTINDGSWHQAVGVYNSVTGLASLYVDGVFQGSATQAGSSGNVNKLLRLGANINTSSAITQPYDGQVDEAMLFSYPLNANQVKDLYNKGSVQFR